jgi:hypothetical protein
MPTIVRKVKTAPNEPVVTENQNVTYDALAIREKKGAGRSIHYDVPATPLPLIVSYEGVDTTFINYLVRALMPILGDVAPGTFVKAPGKRFHPVYHKWMSHNGWDVVFKNPRKFNISELTKQLNLWFKVVSVDTGSDARSGNFIKLNVSPLFIDHPSTWNVVLCHFNMVSENYIQGSTGASTGDHVHIGIRVHGQVA